MRPRHLFLTAAVVALLAGVTAQVRAAESAIQVVGDAACPYYADDISSFATCEGDQVSRADAPLTVSEVSATQARTMLLEARGNALFVDVRTWHEVAFVGRPVDLDAVVPFQDIDAIAGEPAAPTVRMRRTPGFVDRIATLLSERVLDDGATIVLICRSGERSREAALELMRAGYRNVHSVKDGFEGPLAKQGPEQGRRAGAGWRHAGLPWQQRTGASTVR